MAIPWWTQYGPLGHPAVEEHVEKVARRSWWNGFCIGLGIGVAWMAVIVALKQWLLN